MEDDSGTRKKIRVFANPKTLRVDAGAMVRTARSVALGTFYLPDPVLHTISSEKGNNALRLVLYMKNVPPKVVFPPLPEHVQTDVSDIDWSALAPPTGYEAVFVELFVTKGGPMTVWDLCALLNSRSALRLQTYRRLFEPYGQKLMEEHDEEGKLQYPPELTDGGFELYEKFMYWVLLGQMEACVEEVENGVLAISIGFRLNVRDYADRFDVMRDGIGVRVLTEWKGDVLARDFLGFRANETKFTYNTFESAPYQVPEEQVMTMHTFFLASKRCNLLKLRGSRYIDVFLHREGASRFEFLHLDRVFLHLPEELDSNADCSDSGAGAGGTGLPCKWVRLPPSLKEKVDNTLALTIIDNEGFQVPVPLPCESIVELLLQ